MVESTCLDSKTDDRFITESSQAKALLDINVRGHGELVPCESDKALRQYGMMALDSKAEARAKKSQKAPGL
jgi:hypothetical protein